MLQNFARWISPMWAAPTDKIEGGKEDSYHRSGGWNILSHENEEADNGHVVGSAATQTGLFFYCWCNNPYKSIVFFFLCDFLIISQVL